MVPQPDAFRISGRIGRSRASAQDIEPVSISSIEPSLKFARLKASSKPRY
jgi:hypothetical protein